MTCFKCKQPVNFFNSFKFDDKRVICLDCLLKDLICKKIKKTRTFYCSICRKTVGPRGIKIEKSRSETGEKIVFICPVGHKNSY